MGSNINSENFGYTEDFVYFFGAHAYLSDEQWHVVWAPILGCVINGVPDPALMDDIKESIDGDKEAGNGDKTAMLLVAPQIACDLVSKGLIEGEKLEKAVECDDHIDIPGVDIDGLRLTVRVMKDPVDYSWATADAEGNIL